MPYNNRRMLLNHTPQLQQTTIAPYWKQLSSTTRIAETTWCQNSNNVEAITRTGSQSSSSVNSVSRVRNTVCIFTHNNTVLYIAMIRRTCFIVSQISDGHKSRLQTVDATLEPVGEAGFHFRRDVGLLPQVLPATESFHQLTRHFLVFLHMHKIEF